jgi:hypothetical protein
VARALPLRPAAGRSASSQARKREKQGERKRGEKKMEKSQEFWKKGKKKFFN